MPTPIPEHYKSPSVDSGVEPRHHHCHVATRPEVHVRFKWEPNSIVFWDDRCTQHYAVADYFPRRRLMQRVTIAGDRPYC